MRMFVALALPAETAGELERAVAPLRPAWPELRWTGQDAWHLTLAFLGEVSEPAHARLVARLARAAAGHPRMSLSLGGAGAFPGAARARVLWTGVHGDQRALTVLASAVSAAARKAGAPPATARRRYQPHLTLARCRAPADVRGLVAALAGYAGTPWSAGEIYLIHSRPNALPRYETLGTWPLRAGEGERGGAGARAAR